MVEMMKLLWVLLSIKAAVVEPIGGHHDTTGSVWSTGTHHVTSGIVVRHHHRHRTVSVVVDGGVGIRM